MRDTFDISLFETTHYTSGVKTTVKGQYAYASRLFVNQVTSDGYSATTDEGREEVQQELFQVSNGTSGYVSDVVIGLDPGMQVLCIAVKEARCPQQRRRKRKKDRPVWIRRPPLNKRRNERDIVQPLTSKEYLHMTGFKQFTA